MLSAVGAQEHANTVNMTRIRAAIGLVIGRMRSNTTAGLEFQLRQKQWCQLDNKHRI